MSKQNMELVQMMECGFDVKLSSALADKADV
jgi:hypothetical protein